MSANNSIVWPSIMLVLNAGFCVLVPLRNFTKFSLTVDVKLPRTTRFCQLGLGYYNLRRQKYCRLAVLRLKLILTIEGFCCDIAMLFYGTALKCLTALIFVIAINSLKR